MMNATLTVTTPTDREIVMTRTFRAPRRLVWQAMTNPDLLRRWLFGPPGWSMTTCEEDQRIGGAFHWAWQGPNGESLAMRGVYRELTPPGPTGQGGRLVRTEIFEFGCIPQSGEQVATLVLTERGDQTILTITIVYPSKEARDGTIASGMEHGVAAGYDRLEQLLEATPQPQPQR